MHAARVAAVAVLNPFVLQDTRHTGDKVLDILLGPKGSFGQVNKVIRASKV